MQIRIRLWPETKAEFFLIKAALSCLGREENVDNCMVSKTITVLSTGAVGILQTVIVVGWVSGCCSRREGTRRE